MRTSLLLLGLLVPLTATVAAPEAPYRQALHLAASGHDARAAEMLERAASAVPAPWKARMRTAAALLRMRHARSSHPDLSGNRSPQAALARAYLAARPAPETGPAWPVAVLAALLPGAGHLRLGRPRDAAVVAVFVWPMLLLTLWAWKRRMGPVTVFFALITLWLWSGSIFSALSLHERGGLGAYLRWWQGLWQAAALPGRPW